MKATSAQKVAKAIAESHTIEEPNLQRRMSMLKKTDGVQDYDLRKYEQTEILRQSMKEVRSKANVTEAARHSPKKVYSGVKSKIAGNMRSITRTNK